MSDAPWDDDRLNDQRVDMMGNNRSTKSCDDGYAIIDDTGNPKSGDSTHATSRQWMVPQADSGWVLLARWIVGKWW